MERGVMLPPIHVERNGFGILGDLPFLQTVPIALLYWDKIYAPIAVRGMSPSYDNAVDSLIELGAAESIDLKSENSFSSHEKEALIKKYRNALASLDGRKSEVWSVLPLLPVQDSTIAAQVSPYLPNSRKTIASIEVCLRKALPVPEREIPYNDILEFKEKRRDQLNRLHAELTQLSSRYVLAADDETALKLSMNDLTNAVSELQKVYEEKWIIKVTKNFSAAFAIEGLLPASVTYLAGVPIDKAFMAGAGCAIVRSAVSASLPPKHKNNPYAYTLDASKL
uniref:DUF6236 family protein n=1 Tax=Roseovarius indicus TaxID=540747 RepID=UPI003B526F6E